MTLFKDTGLAFDKSWPKGKVTVTTCEGQTVTTEVPKGLMCIEIPLFTIKEYVWSDTFGRDIPVHFREVFELESDYYVENQEAHERGDFITFNRWCSVRVE